MRRLLILVSFSLSLLVLVLTACTAKGGSANWGSLNVSFANVQAQPGAWTANLQVSNRTDKTHVVQYNAQFKYTLHVYKGGKEIYKQAYAPLSKPELLNILPGASESHIMAWGYRDQAGTKVAPGKYQVKAEIHGTTTSAQGGPVLGPVDVEVK